jgi:hypothetical protein
MLDKMLGPVLAAQMILRDQLTPDNKFVHPEDYRRVLFYLTMWDIQIQDRLKDLNPDRKHIRF